MRGPDMGGRKARAWIMRQAGTIVRQWLIESDKGAFHPFWNRWMFSACGIAGPDAADHRHGDDESHQIAIIAVQPNQPPIDPDNAGLIMYLTPPDLVLNVRRLTDAQVTTIVDRGVEDIVAGIRSPDQDFREYWERRIREAETAYLEAQ